MGDHRKQACKNGHPLTPENIVTNSEGFRECRTCRNKREAIRRRKKRMKSSSRKSASRNVTGASRQKAASSIASATRKQSACSQNSTGAVSFEREFLKLAGTMLACTLEIMGGKVSNLREMPKSPNPSQDRSRRNLEFLTLGLVDHCTELRFLCAESLARTNRKGPGGT